MVIALSTHRADAIPELILAFLASDDRHLVIFAIGQAEQPRALVTGYHRRLEPAEAIVHLPRSEVFDHCEGLALGTVVEREQVFALLAADVHGIFGLGDDVAEEEGTAVAEAADEDAFGGCDGGRLAAEVALACF